MSSVNVDPGRERQQSAWALDPQSRQLAHHGQAVALGERAFDLLLALARAPGQVVANATLLGQVWPGRVVEENNLHVHMAALRRTLGAAAIRTVRGRGYQLTERVLLHDPHRPAPAPAPSAPAPPREAVGNIPRHMAPLIGREAETRGLLALLAQQRSVTVTGSAGVGKTSLAKVAASLMAQQATDQGGVWLVELAGAADGSPVAEVVARALGISLPGLQSAEDELVDVLRHRSLLLLLDNCEHRAQEAARLVLALVQGTAGVDVLATSQVPLQHLGEQRFALLPLALPGPGASMQEVRASPAVALFCSRLAERSLGAAVAAGDAARMADVQAICERLDGLPLALELAAARVPLLGLVGVRERLGEQLKLLCGGRHDAPARQQTLRTALLWSHALLGDAERRALRRLGVFAGGFTLQVAQQVIGDGPPESSDDDWGALNLLQSLLDKSLLVPQSVSSASAAMPRLRLLESTRSFAKERLHEAGETSQTTLRLAGALLRLFERDDGPRESDSSVDDAEARAPELDNLRAVLDSLGAAPGASLPLIELTGASAWIWSRLGLRAEGLRRCRTALQQVDAQTPAPLEARLQLAWATLASRRGAEGDTAAALRAAELYKGLGNRIGRFRALSVLAIMLALEGDQPACEAALEDLADSFDPGWGLLQWGAYHWTMGACLAQFDRWDEVLALGRSAVERMSALGQDSWLAVGLAGWAQVSAALGDYATAVAQGEKAVGLIRKHQVRGRLGIALGDLATYLVEVGRLEDALPLAREAVVLRATDGGLGEQLDQLARLACARGRFREAAMALARADLHHARRGGRRDRYLQNPHRTALAAVSQALSADEIASLRARGARMGDDEVARLTVGDA